VVKFLWIVVLGVMFCIVSRCVAAQPDASPQNASGRAASQATSKPAEPHTTVEPLLTEQAEDNANAAPRPYTVPAPAKGSSANLAWRDFPAAFADYYCTQGFGPPTVPSPKPAFCKSDRPLLAHTPKGMLTSAMLFDQSKGSGVYDTLYVDFNGTGDFLAGPAYTAVPFDNTHGPDTGQVVSWFPNVHIRRSGKDLSVHVQVLLEFIADYGSGGSPPFNVCAIPQRWAVGTVSAGSQTLPVALLDHNWNDSVTDIAGRDPKQDDRVTHGDYMILGEAGSRQLQPNQMEQPFRRGSPRTFLTPYLQLDTSTYEVKAATSGQGIRLELLPATFPMGKMLTPMHECEPLVLVGINVSAIVNGRGRQIIVPQDWYIAPGVFGGRQLGPFLPTRIASQGEMSAQTKPAATTGRGPS
jgi:hypothetical protein